MWDQIDNDIVPQQLRLCSSQSSDVTSHVCGDVKARSSLNMEKNMIRMGVTRSFVTIIQTRDTEN